MHSKKILTSSGGGGGVNPPVNLQQKITVAGSNNLGKVFIEISNDGSTIYTGDLESNVYIFTRSGSTWSLFQNITLNFSDEYILQLKITNDNLKFCYSTNKKRYGIYERSDTSSLFTLNEQIVDATLGSSINISEDGSRLAIASPVANRVNIYTTNPISLEDTITTVTPDARGTTTTAYHFTNGNSEFFFCDPREDTDGTTDKGAGYRFTRSGSVWTQQQRIIPDFNGDLDFGNSSDITSDGNKIFLSARRSNEFSVNGGALYILERSGNDFIITDKIPPQPSIPTGGGFSGNWSVYGISCSSDGSILSTIANDVRVDRNYTVYYFEENGSNYTSTNEIDIAEGGTSPNFDGFGRSVSLADDGTLVIPAYLDDDAGVDAGAIYVYKD